MRFNHIPSRLLQSRATAHFTDGSATERVAVEYPLGHRRRRREGVPVLLAKFEKNLRTRLPPLKADQLLALCSEAAGLHETPVHRFMELLAM